MKLSLEELKVESYASQVSETELTAVKGGSSMPCAGVAGLYTVGAAIVAGAVALTNKLVEGATDHAECDIQIEYEYDECGNLICETRTHLCNE